MNFEKEIEKLKKKYPKKVDLVEDAIDDAKIIYKNLRRSYEQETFDENETNWIKRCADELIKNDEYRGMQSYSETGYSLSFFENEISPTLRIEVIPKIRGIV